VLAALLLSWLFRARIQEDLPALKPRALWLLLVGGSGFALFNIVLYSAFACGAAVVNVSIITALIPVMAEASIITKPMMDITGWNWTPSTRAVSPATKTTPAKAARRRWTRC